jgi:hypothetical protein
MGVMVTDVLQLIIMTVCAVGLVFFSAKSEGAALLASCIASSDVSCGFKQKQRQTGHMVGYNIHR